MMSESSHFICTSDVSESLFRTRTHECFALALVHMLYDHTTHVVDSYAKKSTTFQSNDEDVGYIAIGID